MTRIQPPIQVNHVRPIDPAWRSAIFGGCERLNDAQCQIRRKQLAVMKHAFRLHGGFLDTDEVALRLRCSCDQPITRLARWIVSRSIVCISWEAKTLIPVFQFVDADMAIRPSCTAILAELLDVLDNWEIGLWFAAPNPRLGFATPVAILAQEGPEVLRAARRDRFLAQS